MPRPHHDWHNPGWDISEADLKDDCCRQNCQSVHANGGYTCTEGQGPRDDDHQTDWNRDPSELQGECCEKKPDCYLWGNADGNECGGGMVLRTSWDWHECPDDNCNHDQCCKRTCAGWDGTCPAGTEKRDEGDMHECPDTGCDEDQCCTSTSFLCVIFAKHFIAQPYTYGLGSHCWLWLSVFCFGRDFLS